MKITNLLKKINYSRQKYIRKLQVNAIFKGLASELNNDRLKFPMAFEPNNNNSFARMEESGLLRV